MTAAIVGNSRHDTLETELLLALALDVLEAINLALEFFFAHKEHIRDLHLYRGLDLLVQLATSDVDRNLESFAAQFAR